MDVERQKQKCSTHRMEDSQVFPFLPTHRYGRVDRSSRDNFGCSRLDLSEQFGGNSSNSLENNQQGRPVKSLASW